MAKRDITTPLIPPKQLTMYYRRAVDLADFFEDLLEAQGSMRPTFLHGLKRSHLEVAQGKVRKIRSLVDLH